MKQKLSLYTSAALLAAASQASAQGLSSIGRSADSEFATKVPFSWYVGGQVGWDSNPLSRENDEKSSAYASATIGADYSTGDRRRTAYDFHFHYSPLYYFDAPRGMDDFQNNVGASFDWRHRVNPRLTLTGSAYATYEVEPNFNVGAGISRRTDEYFYAYNNIAAAYSWNRRFSTVTGFTISGISYDENSLSGEDYLNYTFSQDFRYAYSRTTTGVLTYRYAIGEYDNNLGDYDSHYFLIGVDHKFNPRLTGSLRVGGEIRDRDFGGSSTDPYAEGSLAYLVSRRTDVRFYTRVGFEDGEVSSYGKRYGYRVGLTGSHLINSRLKGNVGIHYIRDEFKDGFFLSGFDEDVIALSASVEYALSKQLSVNAGYSFTTTSNDSPGNIRPEYDRHNVNVGFQARF